MATLKTTPETTTELVLQPTASSRRLKMATGESAPVPSAAQQLRLQLETALAGSRGDPGRRRSPAVVAYRPRRPRDRRLTPSIRPTWAAMARQPQAVISTSAPPTVTTSPTSRPKSAAASGEM